MKTDEMRDSWRYLYRFFFSITTPTIRYTGSLFRTISGYMGTWD